MCQEVWHHGSHQRFCAGRTPQSPRQIPAGLALWMNTLRVGFGCASRAGAEGPYGDGPSALPAPFGVYPAEQRAVALLLKSPGPGSEEPTQSAVLADAKRREDPRTRRPSFAKSALCAALAAGAPISAACVDPSSCCWFTTDRCAFGWSRDLRRIGVRFRSVGSGPQMVSLRDVEGVVRLAPRWRFCGAHLGGSEMAASLLGLMLVGLLLRLVLLAASGACLASKPHASRS